jgi:serine/threonine protein kinase
MSADGTHTEPGEELGPFRIGNRLGVGGMGIVFEALDTSLNRRVALKVISPHIGDDEEFRARFIREAQAQASLDSPHVVSVYSFGEADGRLYIASQLIPDGDLGQMLSKHGRPPARIAVNLISQIADGLADAHAAGLVHRDIKPANVLLRNRDHQLQAFLGDFGIARQVGQSQLTQAGGTVGTPSYMAPELHMGSDSGVASDIYSLGCLLWAALSGKAPYAGSTHYQIVMGHVEQPIPQLAPTGPLAAEINRVLRTSMAKNPAERYPSASSMRDDLKRVVRLPDDPTPVHPTDAGPMAEIATQPWSFPASKTPTPTPTPTPPPVSSAPAAPPFRPDTPGPVTFTPPHQQPQHAQHGQHGQTYGHTYAGGPQRPGSSSKVGWIIAAVLVLVLAGGAVVAAIAIASDDSGGGGGGGSTPGGGGGGGGTTATDEERAVDALGEFFASEADVDGQVGDCIAGKIVDQFGVARLQESGLLTDDIELNTGADNNTANDTEILTAIFTSAFTCAAESAGASPSS